MMYIRSTDIEQKNWEFLLLSFPDEALYYMTLGHEIVIEDKCNKKHGKIQRVFAPAFSDFLRWLIKKETVNKSIIYHIECAIQAYKKNKLVKRKYDFFRHKLKTCSVSGKTVYVEKEVSVWEE